MNDYIVFMHGDAPGGSDGEWATYLARLRASGRFSGGSAIGDGECVRNGAAPAPLSAQLTGYLRVQAADLTEVKTLLVGNPVLEHGGTVEIRLLPRE